MKKSKMFLSAFAVLFFVIAIVVCIGAFVPSKSAPSGQSSKSVLEKNYENLKQDENDKQEESTVVPDDKPTDEIIADKTKNKLEYFINSKSVKKVKEISGETTVFNLNFKLFIMNDSGVSKTVLANAFSASYDIGEFGSLYTFSCNETDKYFVVDDGEVIDLDFSLKYIVTNTDEFLDFEKYDLVINYMLEEILSFNV